MLMSDVVAVAVAVDDIGALLAGWLLNITFI
jgi:hypothetical protein